MCVSTTYGSTLSCSAPITVSSSSITPAYCKAAINEQGRAAVMWTVEDHKEDCVEIALRTPDIGWIKVTFVKDSPDSQATLRRCRSSLAVDTSGSVFACWLMSAPTPKVQFCKISPQNAVFSETLSSQGGFEPFSAAVSNKGQLFVMNYYQDENCLKSNSSSTTPSKGFVEFNVPLDKVGKRPTRDLLELQVGLKVSKDSLCVPDDGLFISLNGQPAFLWGEWNKPLQSIWYDEGKWSATEVVCPFFNTLDLQVAFNQSLRGICWDQVDSSSGTSHLKARAVWWKNGVWSPIQELSTASEYGVNPRIAVDKKHMLIVWEAYDGRTVWGTLDDHESKIAAAYKDLESDQLVFLDPTHLNGANEMPLIESDHRGNFIVVWQNLMEERSAIYGAVFSTETLTWSSPVLLSPLGADCDLPSIALAGNGCSIIAWRLNDGLSTCVQVADLIINGG